MSNRLLDVRGLSVAYPDPPRKRLVRIVDDVSFHIDRGEALGIAGESGCGKTTTALSLLSLLPNGLRRTQGEISLHPPADEAGGDPIRLDQATPAEMRAVRWNRISIIFQGAMGSLDPVMRIGDQIAEAIRVHDHEIDRPGVAERVAELLGQVGLPARRARQYPHELSGGQRQRVMIALALACRPELVIGDEPTTALDVMMQAQILELLEELRRELGLALLLITHDLAVLGETCDRIAVMYGGQIVESGTVDDVYDAPRHPYTERLLQSFPEIGGPRELHTPISGLPPDPAAKPAGCLFAPRCHLHDGPRCDEQRPAALALADQREVRCHLAERVEVGP